MSTSLVPSPFGTTQQPSGPVPLRQWDGQHGAPDGFDPQRIALVRHRWNSQNAALLRRDRTVEENIRMLSGRQWDVWSPVLGQFVDPTRYLTDSEKRWRQRPVVNVLQYWFLLTHARITETPPTITFQPATADRNDAVLAETLDTVFKTLWSGELDMDDVLLRAAAWLITSGECYFETGAEYGANASQYLLQAPATLSMTRDDGSMIERDTSEPVPYGMDGQPMASLVPQGDDYGYQVPDYQAEGYQGQQPAMVKEGCPKVRVYSPLEVRAEWGAGIPWVDKRWVICRRFLTVEEVKDLYGVDVTPDTNGSAGDVGGSTGALKRMLFGAGNFQSVGNWGVTGDDTSAAGQYCTVDTMWEKPDAAVSPETGDSPGGRLLVVTPNAVLHDSARPYKTQGAGPIRRAQFVQVPGRAGLGSTPLEQMVPVQKTYNRGWAQILEHRNRCTNPILVYDAASGFADQMSNLPGAMVQADFAATAGRPPAAYLAPPPLSSDVWKIQQMLFQLLMQLGSMAGAEGETPTDSASGELVAQLRFNSDRPVSVAVRSLAYALAGVADDLTAVLPTCWPAEKTITYAGQDAILRTVTILPEMWDQGHVHAKPDLISAVPESQPARQAKLERWYGEGVFGPPGTPEANEKFLSVVQFPDMNRVTRLDGGEDKATCERFIVQIVQGAPAQQITAQFKPWYNYDVFLKTVRDHNASPDFLSYDQNTQAGLSQLYEAIIVARKQALMLNATQIAAPQAQAMGAVQGMAASAQAATAPQPPQGESLTAGSPPPGDAQAA